jgi:hypothetical protein
MVIMHISHVKILKHGFEPFVKSNISELLALDISNASRYSQNDMLNLMLLMSTHGSYAERTSNAFGRYVGCPSSDTLLS